MAKKKLSKEAANEQYYLASQWVLMGRKLKKHKLARISMVVLIILYLAALFGDFLAPYSLEDYQSIYKDCSPTTIHFVHNGENVGPFVYKLKKVVDKKALTITYEEDTSEYYPIQFFVHGYEYKILGFIPCDLHLFGVGEGSNGGTGARLYLFGGDTLGRDLYSRVLIGAQISLSMPFASAVISLFLGVLIGGISGYFGGVIDVVIQRIVEVLSSIPTIPLWMALSAAIPVGVSSTEMYFYMTIILSFINWTGMAKTVRGKFLSLKNEDYVMSAKLSGVSTWTIIWTHLVPGFMSHLIVSASRSIPGSISGETSMSYLGLGIRTPATSWGVLLQECSSVVAIISAPHKMIPIIFVVITVMAYNFFGDGLRDAADPYK